MRRASLHANIAHPEPLGELGSWTAGQCRAWAKKRRREGYLDKFTLAAYRQAFRRSRRGSDLVAYLTFRRELGHPLTPAFLPMLDRVRWSLGPRAWLDACHLVAECGFPVWMLPLRFGLFRRRFCAMSATMAAGYAGRAEIQDSLFLSGLAEVVLGQETRRDAFKAHVRAVRRLCVVGNAAGLNGAGLGARIDDHDCVVRFNQYLGAHTRLGDVGGRSDVWVRMPGVARPGVPFVGDWVVLSGPDVRYRSSDWQAVEPMIAAGKSLLTIPMEIWHDLVAQLEAPPSAGLLFLSWLRNLRENGLAGVSLAGFDRRASSSGSYHHAVPGKQAGIRHRWAQERALLAEWATRDGALWLER